MQLPPPPEAHRLRDRHLTPCRAAAPPRLVHPAEPHDDSWVHWRGGVLNQHANGYERARNTRPVRAASPTCAQAFRTTPFICTLSLLTCARGQSCSATAMSSRCMRRLIGILTTTAPIRAEWRLHTRQQPRWPRALCAVDATQPTAPQPTRSFRSARHKHLAGISEARSGAHSVIGDLHLLETSRADVRQHPVYRLVALTAAERSTAPPPPMGPARGHVAISPASPRRGIASIR